MKKTEILQLTLGDEQVPCTLTRKQVKRLNLRMSREGELSLSAPLKTPQSAIDDFLKKHRDWILAARKRVLARRGDVFPFVTGATLSLLGEPHTLLVERGSPEGVERLEGRLCLTVSDPLDEARCRAVFLAFIKKEARRLLVERARALYPLFAPRPATFPDITVRFMDSRWGSCTAARDHITLNAKLLFLPLFMLDYVICHEFCHFRHQNHSAAFYAELAKFYPQYVLAQKELLRASVPRFE